MSKFGDNIISRWFVHFFHLVSNVKPLVWISGYALLIPVFAFFYWLLPDGQFHVPSGMTLGFGNCLYYSIVTITTLGFGDYTPAGRGAQCITCLEVVSGLMLLGFFLNAVGAMKSEIDLSSERERQRAMHCSREHEKLIKSIPLVMHRINSFMAYCYAATTPVAQRKDSHDFNSEFTLADMADMYQPSGFPDDLSGLPVAEVLMRQAGKLSLCLDTIESRIDLTIWPDLLEDCFSFVANYQLLDSIANFTTPVDSKIIASATQIPENTAGSVLRPVVELYAFIKENAVIARRIEVQLTKISTETVCTVAEETAEDQ